MYRAKARGRQQFALFDETLRHEALQRLELERELRRAIAQGEFEPWYQPIVGLVDGRVLGYEALLRWRLPDGRVRTPFEFLGAAEDAGLLATIDWAMYDAVCRDLATLTPVEAYVSLNLSPRLLVAPDFATRFLDLLARHGLSGQRLCLEVTEGALIERPDLAKAQMATLAQAGVRLVIDDFGTGYSSLSYLPMFPLSGLKIDRSFALQLGPESGAGSRPIIRAIVAMASSLGLDVVSEGIETEEQRQAMYALGVRRAQGYLFGKPAPLPR
jgi:EAL domain-containing protein (putative c-di-GMP-specific phosphodiesterase class I)